MEGSLQQFTMCYGATVGVVLLLSLRNHFCYFQRMPQPARRPKVLGMLPVPFVPSWVFVGLGVLFLFFLGSVFFGYQTPWFFVLLISVYFFYFAQIIKMDEIKQKTHIIPLVFLILLVQQFLGDSFVDDAIFLIKCVVVQVYCSSALQKIRTSSWKWMEGTPLQSYLMSYYLQGGFSLAWEIAKRKKLCCFLSILTILFELSSILTLFWTGFGYVFVGMGLLFHLGIYLTMRINYLKFFCPIYWVFLF